MNELEKIKKMYDKGDVYKRQDLMRSFPTLRKTKRIRIYITFLILLNIIVLPRFGKSKKQYEFKEVIR